MRVLNSVRSERSSLHEVIFVLALGTITWCFSEPVFWARLEGEGNDPASAILTWSLYCGVTYLALLALRRFRATGVAGLFLVGAIVGWLIEGALVPEIYTAPPFSIAFTALAWHALLSVLVGWWLLPALLRRGGVRAWIVCAAIGVAWGIWSLDPRMDEEAPTLAGVEFSLLAFAIVGILAAAYAAAARWRPGDRDLVPGWPAALVVAALGAWATLTIFVPVPFAPILLAALLGLALWCLWRLRPRRPATDFLTAGGPGVALPATVPLTGIALGASLTNASLAAGGITAPAVLIAATALTAVGVGLLAWSVLRAVRARPA